MSLSTRIALGVATVLAVTILILGAAMVRATVTTLTAEIDNRLITAVDRASHVPGPWIVDPKATGNAAFELPSDQSPGPDVIVMDGKAIPDIVPRNVALTIVGPGGKVWVDRPSGFDDAPDARPALPPIPGSLADQMNGRIVTVPAVDNSVRYRLLLQTGPAGWTIVTAASLRPVDEAISRLIHILIAAGAAALVIASLVSWWVIQRGLLPVDRMVETAAAIAEGDLSRRVPDSDPETELGRLGAALNEMLGQIEAGVREREAGETKLRRFAADAAHELRTPLTSLRGYAELYRRGALQTPDAIANAMGRIEAEGARMARLVDDLLLLARTDQGRALVREPVDLVRLAREATDDFTAADPDRPFQRNFAPSAMVLGDPIRLRQAIDNLLANIRAHTPSGTRALVSVDRSGSWAEVTVADEGPGIPAEDQTRVFDRFWSGDPARGHTATGGTGLGLSIVDALVRAHGGSIQLRSAPGEGSVFTLRLPLWSGDPVLASGLRRAPEASS
jgi:two-component system OmpR family sensor kinase